MKKIFCIISLFISFLNLGFTQGANNEAYIYDYDAAGNRISRRLIVITTRDAKIPSSNNEISSHNDTIISPLGTPDALKNISIYPNPVQGSLQIDLSGFDITTEPLSIELTGMNGAVLLKNVLNSDKNTIDFTSYQPGYYNLNIISLKDRKYFKILKQ